MRNILFALVLANLAFAAWHAWFAQRPVPSYPENPDLPQIMLLKELPPEALAAREVSLDPPLPSAPRSDANAATPPPEGGAQTTTTAITAANASAEASPPAAHPATASSAAAAAPSTPQALPNCTSVGPFRELAQAATAAANLRAAGYEPSQRAAEGDIWIGYWVYIEALPSEAEANAVLAKIRANGIADSYMIPNSDTGHLVSLGVFSEISGVNKQRDKVRALGYEPTIADRTRRATVYWVDVALENGQVFDLNALQTPGRITRLEQRACEAPAA